MKRTLFTIAATLAVVAFFAVLFTKGRPQIAHNEKEGTSYIKIDLMPTVQDIFETILPKKKVTHGDVLQNVIDNGGTVFYNIQSEDGLFSKSSVMTDSTGGSVSRGKQCENCSEYVMSSYFADAKEKKTYNKVFEQIGDDLDLHTSPVFRFELTPGMTGDRKNPGSHQWYKWELKDPK